MTISAEKAWAEGMEQEAFEKEFMKRNPTADTIPLATEWLGVEPLDYKYGIDPFNPETLEIEDTFKPESKQEEEPKEKKKKTFACRGCGRPFDYPIARSGHEKHCKQIIKV